MKLGHVMSMSELSFPQEPFQYQHCRVGCRVSGAGTKSVGQPLLSGVEHHFDDITEQGGFQQGRGSYWIISSVDV